MATNKKTTINALVSAGARASARLALGKAPKPFSPRLPKIPVQMQHSSELWLDFFTGFAAQMLEDCGPGQRVDALGHARVLADAALTIFEERWPGVRL